MRGIRSQEAWISENSTLTLTLTLTLKTFLYEMPALVYLIQEIMTLKQRQPPQEGFDRRTPMNISMIQPRTNLSHLIAFLLVCTMAFVTVAAPVLAFHCDDEQQAVAEAQSDIDTYDREAAEYKQKYDNASWKNPMKGWYWLMYHRALDRMYEAMQRKKDAEAALKACEEEHEDEQDSGGCSS